MEYVVIFVIAFVIGWFVPDLIVAVFKYLGKNRS